VFWEHYWDWQHCSYVARTGDLRSVITNSDFYSAPAMAQHRHDTDYARPLGQEHSLMVRLPRALPQAAGSDRHVRLELIRGAGPDFSERDRAVLTLLGPHLDQAYLEAERCRHPVPRLTPRQKDLLRLVAAGHTNSQIARRLGISEGTVRTHLENIYDRACPTAPPPSSAPSRTKWPKAHRPASVLSWSPPSFCATWSDSGDQEN
jgi:hypothetical protein